MIDLSLLTKLPGYEFKQLARGRKPVRQDGVDLTGTEIENILDFGPIDTLRYRRIITGNISPPYWSANPVYSVAEKGFLMTSMGYPAPALKKSELLELFLALCRIDSPSGEEMSVGDYIIKHFARH